QLSFKIINSSTILLPTWKLILAELGVVVTKMPQNVATCWNSTFIFLDYALNHREAVNQITQR
ncbi:hypothetical protein OG21DRAFT_1422976, partial [Imleria badia]